MTNNQNNYFSLENINKWKHLSGKKVLIINTQWNTKYIDSMTNKAIELFEKTNIKFDIITAPGAYEIPFVAKIHANKYDGVITIGCVIKGDTFHFEAIALTASLNISKVAIETEVPISFGVITVNNIEQAEERTRDDQTNKGLEAAGALLDLMLINEQS